MSRHVRLQRQVQVRRVEEARGDEQGGRAEEVRGITEGGEFLLLLDDGKTLKGADVGEGQR